MPRVLFICRKPNAIAYHYGIGGLFNSATFVARAISDFAEAKVILVKDENAIDKEVFEYKPDIVILEAIWITPKKLTELANLHRYRNIRWVIRVHSKPTFLANEGIAVEWLPQYDKIRNVTVSGNNYEFNIMADTLDIHSEYLPNIYLTPYRRSKKQFAKHCIDIGCFGAIRPMKNQLAQAIAAIRFADELGLTLFFHINATRLEQGGQSVLKNLRATFAVTDHELIEHGWLTHPQFFDLISEMDLGMQVSLSESFNIISADFVANNVPIVTSDEIDFVSSWYYAKPNSIQSMVDRLYFAYYTKWTGFHKINQHYLNAHNQHALSLWKNFIL